MNCLFCEIIKGEKEADLVEETKEIVVIKDINPKAPVHYLIIPKKHVESVREKGAESVASNLIKIAKEIAERKNIKGYKLVFNVGREGGQMIDHLHLHFLAGDDIKCP